MTAIRGRGFTVVPAVLGLALLLAALGTTLYFVGPKAQTASAAYNKGFSLGPILGSVFIGIFFVAVASRMAERKGQGLATAVCGGILLLANIAYGVNVLRGFGVIRPLAQGNAVVASNPPRAQAQQTQPERAPSDAPDAAADREAANPITSQPPAPPPAQPQTSQPPAQQPQGAPQSSPQTRPSRESMPKRETARPKEDQLSEQGQAALQELEAEIKAACGKLASEADAAYKKMRKPVTTMSALNKATDEFAALRVAAPALEKRLRNIMEEARERLAKAGEDDFKRMKYAMDWERGMATFERAGACGDLERACDAAESLFAVLKDTLGKWKVDSAGKVTSPDRAVEQRLFIPRSQMGHALDRQNDVLHGLRQGDQPGGK